MENTNKIDKGIHPKSAAFIELVVSVLFVTVSLISNVIAGKVLVLPFGLAVAGASLLYPLTSICDDVTTNCLGYGTARRLTWISVIMNVFMSAVFMIAVAWPGVDPNTSAAYAVVLTQSVRTVVASLIAFAISSFVNSYILQKMKAFQVDKGIKTTNRWHLFFRTFGSSIPAQLLDSFVFTFLAFLAVGNSGWATPAVCVSMALAQFLVKCLVELALQPFLVWFIPFFSKKTGMDVIDREGFNPFKVS